MSKDFSSFLGKKKSKKVDLLGSKKKIQSSDASLTETRDKVETNLGQSAEKLKKNLRRTEEERENKHKKNLRRTEEKLEKKPPELYESFIETREELENKLENKPEKNLRISEEEPEKKSRYTQLVGRQRSIMNSIFMEAYKGGAKVTPPLTVSFISLSSGSPSSSVRKSIQILEKKGCISRDDFKIGRGGWTSYLINSSLYGEMLQLKSEEKLEKNLRRTEEELEYKPKKQLEKIPHSSSYNFNLKKNTTTIVDNSLLEKCALIQVPVELDDIGFKESHLKQIFKDSSLNTDEVQESLSHYALDLRNGSVRAGFGKLNMIVGVLKKSNLYTSEAYIAEERSMLAELSKRSEVLKELKNKEKEIKLLKKYKSWKSKLNQAEINDLVPPDQIIKEGGTLQDIKLQSYFEENYG